MATDPAAPQRKAIVVLGMHRSGSSAMTRVLSLLGAQLPEKLMPSYTFNVPGHWEPQDVADLNDVILGEMDSRWDAPFGPRQFRTRKPGSPDHVARARAVIRENYKGSDDIVLKEPRIAILADLWRRALEAEGFAISYIIMVRSPLEVAASLKTRDGMACDTALLLWTTYMLGSERATRGAPCVYVSFDTLLAQPDETLERIETALNLGLPRRTWKALAEIKDFLDPQHRHETLAGDTRFDAGFEPVGRLYQYFEDAAQDRVADASIPDQVEAWIDAIETTAGPMLGRLELELERRQHTIQHLHDHAINLQSQVDARVAQAEAQQGQIEKLEKLLHDRVAQAEGQQNRIGELTEALEAEKAVQAELARQIEVLKEAASPSPC